MIKVGTCGFKFADWKGTVYPETLKEAEYLPYYDKVLGFDLLEIDVSYYTLLSPRVAEAWLRKTGGDLVFAVKCHKDMTLNERGGEDPLGVENGELFSRFLFSFEPLVAGGRLLTFLAQFGPVFMNGKRQREYILRFKERMGAHPLVVEFRHRSWLDEAHRDETFRFLRENDLACAVVDEPKIRCLAPFVPEATTDLAYVRLHGRSRQWFGPDAGRRYDYFYSDEELSLFLDPVRALGERTRMTAVFFNNCHAGAAVKNAMRFRQLLLQ